MIVRHFPDEEPDFDEREWDVWHEAEVCPDLCPRCGLKHRVAGCHIQPYLLKADA